MIWQDLVISIGQFVFIVSLMPTLLSKDIPPIKTSLPTGLFLLLFGFSFLTLGMYMASLTSTINGIEWLILSYQKFYK